jgi:hypothetical protein
MGLRLNEWEGAGYYCTCCLGLTLLGLYLPPETGLKVEGAEGPFGDY